MSTKFAVGPGTQAGVGGQSPEPSEEECEVEVGRPVMPGTELRPHIDLTLYAPPMASAVTYAEGAPSRSPWALGALESTMGTPLVPVKFAAIAAGIATALASAAAFAPQLTFLPAWVGFALWALAVVAAVLAGVALPAFRGSSPLVPLALVPFFLSGATALATFAVTLPPGKFQTVVMFLAIICAGLGGKALPQPQAPVAGELKQ
jgi:hypothetical protein